MLFGPMKESTTRCVVIPDVVPKAFQYFQRLVYHHHPQLTYDITVHVLYLAQKYLMQYLIQECRDHALQCNQLSDFYKVLNSIAAYAPNTFDGFVADFMSKCKFSKNYDNITMMEHNAMAKIPVYLMQKMMKSRMIHTEQSKYIHCRQYCRVNTNEVGGATSNTLSSLDGIGRRNHSWQQMFKQHFVDLIDFSRIKSGMFSGHGVHSLYYIHCRISTVP